MGSAAAGSTALVGSSAVESVTADRGVSVDIETDWDAYLGLHDTSAYARHDDGLLNLDFGTEHQGGSGVNSDAVTLFEDVFEVRNQGNQDDVITELSGNVPTFIEPDDTAIFADSFVFPDIIMLIVPTDPDPLLDPGESVSYDVIIETAEGTATDSFDWTLEISAEVDNPGGVNEAAPTFEELHGGEVDIEDDRTDALDDALEETHYGNS